MKLDFFVYVHSDPTQLDRLGQPMPFYVGEGSGGRFVVFAHKERGPAYKAVIDRIGRPEVDVFPCATRQEAWELEKFLISEIGRSTDQGPLVNISEGGAPTGRKVAASTCAKLSAFQRGVPKTADHKARMSHGWAKRRARDLI